MPTKGKISTDIASLKPSTLVSTNKSTLVQEPI